MAPSHALGCGKTMPVPPGTGGVERNRARNLLEGPGTGRVRCRLEPFGHAQDGRKGSTWPGRMSRNSAKEPFATHEIDSSPADSAPKCDNAQSSVFVTGLINSRGALPPTRSAVARGSLES